VTVHVDGRRSNRGLVGTAAFGAMKKDVLFINASRGFIVDAAALAVFLKANPGATAALDVHEPEPFGADYPLLGLPNARLLPHLASCTATAQANMSWVVRDVWRVLSGEKPEFPAAPEPA
jgi:D-3-phosphoglycerate dehydrogenase